MKKENGSHGIGFLTVLFLLFLGLKLGEFGAVADWSWWWVCAPLWGPFALILGIAIPLFLLAGIASCVESFQAHRIARKIMKAKRREEKDKERRETES